MAYIGVSPSNGVRQKHTYTATASQTTFSGTGSEGISLSYRDSNYVDVYRNGVKLGDADYTATSGTSIVLGEGAAVSDIIEIVTYDVFSVADTVSKADGGTFDGNVTMAGTLAVTGETTLTTHLNMGDNDIIKLGDSADLQIYHNGTDSLVADTGSGTLILYGDSEVKIADPVNGETMAIFKRDAEVELYHNNAEKLATTSTGIDVTGTAVTDGLTVAGNLSVDGGTIKLDGNHPVGSNNVALGDTALNSNVSGQENTAVGQAALYTNTGSYNTAVGRQALYYNTGAYNVAMGVNALVNNTTASSNTAVGYQSLNANTTGGDNTGFGVKALLTNTTGTLNVSVGSSSMRENTTGGNNVALGVNALRSNTTVSNNTAVGFSSAYSTTTGGNNTSLGTYSFYTNTTGADNVVAGHQALFYNTTGSNNTAIGKDALKANTTGQYNTAIGGKQGNGALGSNTSGGYNTAVGVDAMSSNTTASENTAIGYQAMNANTTGARNSAIGTTSLSANTTGTDNTAVGFIALQDVTTGTTNVAVGAYAGRNITTGGDNIALGRHALSDLQTGGQNVAIGDQSLYNTTGSQNVAVGDLAGHLNITGENVTYVGRFAGYSTTAGNNTFIGGNAGYLITSGANNTIIGRYNGNQGGLDIRTSSNNIVLSDGDGNPRVYVTSTGDIKINSLGNPGSGTAGTIIGTTGGLLVTADTGGMIFRGYSLNSGSPVFQVAENGNVTNTNNSYGAISDEKLKENIVDASSQWDDIKAVQVRKYSLIEDNIDTPNRLGVIAQELEASGMNGLVGQSADTDEDGNELGTVTKNVKYSILYMKAVKALQEAMTRIETLEAKVATLEGE